MLVHLVGLKLHVIFPGNLPWSFLGMSYHSSHYIVTVHLQFCLPSTWEPLEGSDGL